MGVKLEYIVVVPDELAAGIRGFTEEICIVLTDSSPDSETLRDMSEHFRQSVRDWYDMGRVYLKSEYYGADVDEPTRGARK